MQASNWKFDKNITPIFDEHVRQHIPLYDQLHEMIMEMTHWFIEDDTNVYDIGTSTGNLLINIATATPRQNVNLIGIDTSEDMIVKAKINAINNNVECNFVNGNVLEDSFKVVNASLAASILTNQFISFRDRKSLISKIHNGLNEKAAYIVVEKVIGNNAKFNEMWVEMYHEAKLKNGLSEKDVINKSRSIRGVLKPLTIDENVNLLKEQGFSDVDVFFKWCNFAGFIAIK